MRISGNEPSSVILSQKFCTTYTLFFVFKTCGVCPHYVSKCDENCMKQYRYLVWVYRKTNTKELGFFHTIFAQTLTAHNICLTHITSSILIYANALGYVLSIRVEFVMQNMMSICLYCCIWKGGLKSTTSRKFELTNKTAYL